MHFINEALIEVYGKAASRKSIVVSGGRGDFRGRLGFQFSHLVNEILYNWTKEAVRGPPLQLNILPAAHLSCWGLSPNHEVRGAAV